MATVVVQADAERIGELEPLWRALWEHHREAARGMAEVNPLEESWRRRRAQYEEWLAGSDAALFVAAREEGLVGYAMVTVSDPPATWEFGHGYAEVETLSVLAAERGAGI